MTDRKNSTYKNRMADEYRELKERIDRLNRIIVQYDDGSLDFDPTTPIEVLRAQLYSMRAYLSILRYRADIEGVDIGEH